MRHSTALAYVTFPFSSFLPHSSPSVLSIALSFRESINTHPHAHTPLSLGLEAGFNVNENQPISSQLQTALELWAQEGEKEKCYERGEIWEETERELWVQNYLKLKKYVIISEAENMSQFWTTSCNVEGTVRIFWDKVLWVTLWWLYITLTGCQQAPVWMGFLMFAECRWSQVSVNKLGVMCCKGCTHERNKRPSSSTIPGENNNIADQSDNEYHSLVPTPWGI